MRNRTVNDSDTGEVPRRQRRQRWQVWSASEGGVVAQGFASHAAAQAWVKRERERYGMDRFGAGLIVERTTL